MAAPLAQAKWERFWTELKTVWPLALPLAVAQVGNGLTSLVDTAIAGRDSELTLAATGLGAAVFLAGSVLGLGCGYGTEPFVAQAFGAKRSRDARAWMLQGCYAAIVAALPLWATCTMVAWLLPWLQIDAPLVREAHHYLTGRLPSLVPFCLTGVLRAYLQGAQCTRPIVVSAVVMNLFNFVCDWLLLFGDDALLRCGLPGIGLPRLGAFGLGIASTAATVLQAAMLVWSVHHLRSGPIDARSGPMDSGPIASRHGLDGSPTRWFFVRPRWSRMWRILRIGLPAGLQVLAEVGIFATVGMLSGSLGSAAMAAHQSALMLVSCTFAACVGFGMAATVRVGRAVGKRDRDGVRVGGQACIALAAVLMLVSGTAMWVAPRSLMRIMTDVPSVVERGAGLLRIAAVFQLVDGVQAALAGALRGAAITRWPFLVNVVAHWLLGLPLALWLTFRLQLSVDGLWWGLTVGLTVVAVCLWRRFRAYTLGPIVPLETPAVPN